jgi:hypothetical protein
MSDDDRQALVLRSGFAIAAELDVDKFQRIMRAWNFVRQMIDRTREYDTGLYGVRVLIAFAEKHRHELDDRLGSTYLAFLYFFELDMLDRLDRWNAYLARWDELRSQVHIAFECHADESWWKLYGEKARAYLVRQDGDRAWFHFMRGQENRKKLSERKIARAAAGKSTKADQHHPKEELPTEEVERRIAEMLRAAVALSGGRQA